MIPFSTWVRKCITLAPTFSKTKSRALRWFNMDIGVIPSRWESGVLFGFYALGIIFMGTEVNTAIKAGGGSAAVADLIGMRFGVYATVLIPLLFIFAGRNNFLQFVTRWNFSTFLTFHRWIARAVFMLLMGHVGAITYSWKGQVAYSVAMSADWVIWGTVATCGCGVMLFQGMLSLRRLAYEIFLVVHIVLALFFAIGAVKHLDHFEGFSAFAYVAIAVWVFDRCVRLIRIISFGFPEATLTLMPDNIIKVAIPKRSWWKSTPGGYGFIHFLTPSTFFQSHPFTIVDSVDSKNVITVFCRIKGGVTHSIHRKLAAKSLSMTMRVTLEGPYGFQAPVAAHDTVVFIAAGNGIPGIISETLDLAKRTRDLSAKKAELHWVVRNRSHVGIFEKELAVLGKHNIDITIYCTGLSLNPFATPTKAEKYDEKNLSPETLEFDVSASTLQTNSRINWIDRRPDVHTIVRGGIERSNRAVAFVTCASPAMNDEIRSAVRGNLVAGKRIDLIDQLQIWA
ncbi:uncharacterized protein KQ657_003973 [Scheffersomyces spartinae]|uniref:ferric-chelate reductase (NADPH) n=1 Tax=Scheffersomyces spartinae TaxID=45513 RepID=A0A9P8AJK6_9ASCO|nr:uncharacterized protein KQ657_003973 [Scheffersomyces spartinae]KAG7194866.1 hypothetical protein KQ657_003973 [Scheffersomyces spartinae]